LLTCVQVREIGIAALSAKVRNDRGMDSRLRGNDIKGSGNTKEECPPLIPGLPRRFAPRNDNHPHPALSPQGRGDQR